MPKARSVKENMMPSEKRSHKYLYFTVALLMLGFPLFSSAGEYTLDEKIEKIMKASKKEKEILVKQLKDDIAKQKYDNTEHNKSTEHNSSIDKKITNRSSKFIQMSKIGMEKCGPGKCDMGKCGMGTAPKEVIIDDNMSCGCE